MPTPVPGVEAYYEIKFQADPRAAYGEVPVLLPPTAAEKALMVPGSTWVVLDRKQSVRATGRVRPIPGQGFGIVLERPLRVVATEIFAVQRIALLH